MTENRLRNVVENPDMGIGLADGCRLSVRTWMPDDAAGDPVPAILEFLPYRKRDGTVARDCLTHPYFAARGYASIRVDMRGNGDSEGLMEDEYTEQELSDACEVISWLAEQEWCSGAIGMMGISWGGFNSLQVAALQPPALKAIITLCSTVDRFNDDIHYKGGCLLNENLGWGATMLSYSSRPPDPAIVGDKWRGMWLERLENEPFLAAKWLKHQTRNAYWKHGSVSEDYSAIKAATLAIGGWGDSYKNAVCVLAENLDAPVKAIIGPWVHKYPHFAVPEPRIGFLQEALRWWDRWLKDIDTGVEADPLVRRYVLESEPPKSWYTKRKGFWIADEAEPSPKVSKRMLALSPDGTLGTEPAGKSAKAPFPPIRSPQDCGMEGGEYCAIWLGPELPGDQRHDDALSVSFNSAALDAPLDIVGRPAVRLKLAADRPRAQIAVRLCDVQPDGASTRITWGVQNLCYVKSQEKPELLTPGETIEVELALDEIAYRVRPGNRLRIAISSTYWPMVWPSPEIATLELTEGTLALPVRESAKGSETAFPPPDAAEPWATETLREESHTRRTEIDRVTGEVTLHIEDDFGCVRDLDHGLETGSIARERWTIHPEDPLSASGWTHWTQTSKRGEWETQTETFSTMRSDAKGFMLTARIEAYEGEELVFERDFEERIGRGCL